ncbi:MAG: preprotein translocase subunit YajC [Gammaproteobacteria bacterium]|nr:preprotein translocase subunit YajC [Gammaproteobacteria bacterium]
MSFFISDALAETGQAASQQPGILEALFPFIILFIVFYFLLIRPQQKRTKDHAKMVAALQVGDEVITSGGLIGRVTHLGESYIGVALAESVEVTLQRAAITSVVPKGTIDSVS